jgi:di/tricarboxylate transporter
VENHENSVMVVYAPGDIRTDNFPSNMYSLTIIIIIVIIIIMALQLFVGPWPLLQFRNAIHRR